MFNKFLLTIAIHNQEKSLWELKTWSLQGKFFDLLPNSFNKFFEEMYASQSGEFPSGCTWKFDCLNFYCVLLKEIIFAVGVFWEQFWQTFISVDTVVTFTFQSNQGHPATECFQIPQNCLKRFSQCFRSLFG